MSSTEAWHEVLGSVAAAAQDAVVVVGSAPPDASDLDVLVRDDDRPSVEAALRGLGAVRLGAGWVVPRPTPLGVDLLTPTSWNLPAGTAGPLWDRAVPLPGVDGAVVPGPGHELLLAARRLAWNGALGERATARAVRARAAGEVEASALAASWHAEEALAALLALLDGGPAPGTAPRTRAVAAELRGRGVAPPRALLRALRVVLPVPRRGPLLAVSGSDGSGKSTVTHTLIAALDGVGLRPVRRWMRFSHAPAAHALAVLVKRVLRRDDVETAGHQGPADPPGASAASADPAGASVTTRVWAWLLTLTFVLRAGRLEVDRWRGRTVVCDRYVLDGLAELRGRYGLRANHPALRVLRSLTATPTVALLLDVPAEVAVERQDDDQWPLGMLAASIAVYRELAAELQVEVVDATAPRDEVVARAVAATAGGLRSPAR